MVDLKDVLHGGNKGGVGVGRNDPLLLQMRLERVFFSVRLIVLSLARSTMLSSTTALLQQRQRPALAPFGWRRARQCNELGLSRSVEDALAGGVGRVLAGQRGVNATLHQLLTGAGNGVDAGIQRRGDLAVAPGIASVRGIRLQQDARLQHLPDRRFAFLDQHLQLITLLGAELDDEFLHGRLLPGHDASPGVVRGIDSDIRRIINDGGY